MQMLARTNFGTIWLSLQKWWWHVSNHKNFRQHKQNIWKNTFSFQQVWNRYHTNACWKVKFIWQKQKCLFIKQYISVTEISYFPNLGKSSKKKTGMNRSGWPIQGGGGHPPARLTDSICEKFRTFFLLNMIPWYPKQILLHCEEAEKCIFDVFLLPF